MNLKALSANALLLATMAFVLLGYATCGPASALPIPGSEFGVAGISTSARFGQEYVDVCAGNGVYLAVWQDKRSNQDYDIYGVLLDSSGNPLGIESFLISKMPGGTATTHDQIYPAVGFNGTNFLVVWADRRADNLIPRIYATRVTPSGQVLDEGGTPFPTAATPTDQFVPQVASNGTEWEVVWQEKSSAGSDDIYGAAVSSAGTVGTRVAIAYRTDNEQWPSIAWNGTNYLVVWQDLRNSESSGTDIYGSRLTAAGQKVAGSEKLISTAVSPTTNGAPGAQTVPSVAAGSAGTWLVVWQDLRGTNDDIYCARVSSTGNVTDLGGKVVCNAADVQEEPSVGWDGTNFVAAWRDKSASRGIKATRINTSAVPLDGSGVLLSDGAAGPYGPAVAGGSGSSLVAWYSLDAMDPDVYGARMTSAGQVGSVVQWSLCLQDQPQFSVAFDGTNYVAVWSDRRSGVYRVYAARISTSGTLLDPQGVLVSAAVANDQTQPAIAWNGTNFLVVWTELGSVFTDIKGMRLTTSLSQVDVNPINVCNLDQDQNSPAVAWNGTTFLVVWVDYRLAVAPDYYCDIRGARVSPAGVVTSLGNTAVAGGDNNQFAPSVASCGGNFLVAWEDYRTNGSPVVYCSRVTGTGTVQDPLGIQVPAVAYYQVQPKVVTDGTNYLIVWSDKRDGWSNDNIYGVRMSTAAARLDPADILVCGSTRAQVAPSAAWNGQNYLVAWQDGRNWSTSGDDIYMNGVTPGGTVISGSDSLIAGGTQSETHPGIIMCGPGLGLVLYSNFMNETYRTAGRVIAEPPPVPVVTDDGAYSGNPTALHAVWTVAPRQNEVSEYRYAIGTTAGGSDVVGWTSTGLLTEVTRTGLSLVSGTNYFISVQAKNSAGMWGSSGSSDGIIVDGTAPSLPAVTDDGSYVTSNSLHATWSAADPETGVQEYRYAIGTSSGGTNIVGWTSVGTSTGVTRTDLTLTDGTTYFFTVQARNGVGVWSGSGTSDGIVVDTSAPTTPLVVDDGTHSTTSGALHASWNSGDPHSGIEEYRYAIGTSAGGTDIVDWTSVGTSVEITKTGLSLADGSSYFFSVQAKNAAGTWSAAGTSDGIEVDASAPTTPTVTDDGSYTLPGSLHAIWSADDPHSGVQEYRYAIGTTAGGNDVVDWTSAGTSTEITKTGLSLTQGTTYFISVQARNGAGTWSAVGSSDGIALASTPPTTPVVTDDGDYALSDVLHATWSAQDPYTGVQEYAYAIGTSAGGNDVVDWTSAGTATEITRTGLSLVEGPTYYISVKARNGADLWSEVGSSDGITVPPAVNGIVAAKFMPDDSGLRLLGKAVVAGTADLPDLPGQTCFYIEESDCTSGIKVVSAEAIPFGCEVDIAGKIETIDGERQITASDVKIAEPNSTAPGALNMFDRAIGGSALNDYTPGVYESSGPNNIGLLIKTWGKVTYAGGASEDYFYLNSGSFLRDGSGRVGVKVYCGTLTKPAAGSTVLVTGISSLEPLNDKLVRRVLATQLVEYPQ